MWGIHSTVPAPRASAAVPQSSALEENFETRLDGSSPDLSLCGWIPHYKVLWRNDDGSWTEQILLTWTEVRTIVMNCRILDKEPPIVTLMFNLPQDYLER